MTFRSIYTEDSGGMLLTADEARELTIRHSQDGTKAQVLRVMRHIEQACERGEESVDVSFGTEVAYTDTERALRWLGYAFHSTASGDLHVSWKE